jgi:hypothetical protein
LQEGPGYVGDADAPNPDPDERFSLHPMEGEDVLRKLLGPEEGDESVSDDPEDEEGADS